MEPPKSFSRWFPEIFLKIVGEIFLPFPIVSSDDESLNSSVDPDIQRYIETISPEPVGKDNKKRKRCPQSMLTSAKVPKDDLVANSCISISKETFSVDPEDENKLRKTFSMDEDIEILKNVIEILPGKSLANLELPDFMLRRLSVSMSRPELSIRNESRSLI